MLPPSGARRVETVEAQPGRDDVPSPPVQADVPPEEQRRRPRAYDLVALYAVRAEANGIDLRPLVDERRERRPTEAAAVVVALPAATPRPVGRGTAEHRDAVRHARAIGAVVATSRAGGDLAGSLKAWRRWLPSFGVAKLAKLVGAARRDATGPSKRARPRARRVVQGRA